MTQNNIKIAITGGICSGKSTVADFIRGEGYTVISCDEIYAELLRDISFVAMLDNEFKGIKRSDGTLDRAKLSQIVFTDKSKLEKLNSLTHPKIMQKVFSQMKGDGVFFCEIPLLFESKLEHSFDDVIVVLREDSDRLRELMKRNGLDKDVALMRIKSQFKYNNCNFAEYYVIRNDGNLLQLCTETRTVLKKIKKKYT